ncbi:MULTISPECIES: hypothetical protein [Comamonadaceae]|uniref:hypothetical protein n=1 Tax=Acidovorax sacchari TaxID=3230736 RepID=UPI0034A38A33
MTRTAAPAPASVDLRGFTYPLEPYLRKQEWQLERLEARLARLLQDIARAVEQGRELQAQFDAQAQQMQQWMQVRLDPRLHQRGLAYLADARRRIADHTRELEALHAQRVALKAECIAQQRTIDGLQEHRADAVRDYALEAVRLAAAEADRDWIGRMALRAASSNHAPEVME